MKVAVAQMKCTVGNIDANIEQMTAWAKNAADQGCQVIVFPETVDTGYEMTVIREKADFWPGRSFLSVQQIARAHQIHVIAGISEREKDQIYNTIAVFDPNSSLVGKYRKAHLAAYPPLDEDSCFSPGNSLSIATIGEMNWGLLICYDLRFPEMARSLVLKGAEVLVLCSAWPFPRVTHWKTLTAGRAIENQAYVVAANRTGSDGPVTFCGSSCIIDPYGAVLASAAEDREELLVAEIRKGVLTTVRSRMPIFRHRRPELYAC
ncbi:MAG: carbon-nitrogen family hydrolase [candidate division KSB1 bacterium]|nr:carbon-nitrogen family hydrolase [candidate division KSB1 bacterium]MDZ7340932.1 carbon-nitrogen family hydrolase [candidate division KSB1 bacterium]